MKLKLNHHFDAAHRLSNHLGKCYNLHGHRWEVEVIIKGRIRPEYDMMVDFGAIKQLIDENFDHTTLLSNSTENRQLYKLLKEMGLKVFQYSSEPTAEFLSGYIHMLINDLIKSEGRLYNWDIKIKLWESPGAMVKFED